jgi:predicted GH43/DUF377 family glycosyl hydrolase
MPSLDELLELEEGFWRAAGSRDAYTAHLADDVLTAVETVEPWETFSIDDPRIVELGDNAAALVYTARAKRAGQEPYVAAMTSVYRRESDGWELAVHQQTPLG